MAVMTTQHSEGVAVEQKTMPVPSSDKMALDIDINGNSIQPEPSLETTSDPVQNHQTAGTSPSSEPASSTLVNGANLDAFSSNQTIDLIPESQPAEDSSVSISAEALTSSQAADTNTTASEGHHHQEPTSSDMQPNSEDLLAFTDTEVVAGESVSEEAIASALEDTAAPSSVLPVVEAQESDLRDTASSLALAPEPETKSALDLKPEETASFSMEVEKLELNGAGSPDVSFDAPISDNVNGTESMHVDTEMTDLQSSASSTKIAREREDDILDEPSAKRTKMEDDSTMADNLPTDVQMPAQNGESALATATSNPITPYQNKEISKFLRSITRTASGKNFRAPVAQLWPGFSENYLAKISNPVDLGSIETNLKNPTHYPTLNAFIADIQRLYDNALLFNGPEHMITKAAETVRSTILDKVSTIPPEPVVVPKVAKKPAKRSTPATELAPRVTPARRPSRSAGSASTPTTAQTFALDPTTHTPLIRRDSAKADGGRPKRQIHPPKDKDLVYSTQRPKNKKYAIEFKFCAEVVAEMKKPKHATIASPFIYPVDPVSLMIPNYFQVIKSPMDLETVNKKLQNGEYRTPKDFETDVKLIFANCYKFNPPGNPVREMGKQYEAIFDEAYSKKSQWLETHAPVAASPSTNGDSEEEESEEEVERPSVPPPDLSALRIRLNEEQDKLIQMMTNHETPAMIEMQQDLVGVVKKKIEAASNPPPKKAAKKSKASKPAKKPAPAKKSGPAAAKKAHKERQRFLGTLEKEVISHGIGTLPQKETEKIIAQLKAEQDVTMEGEELELDIETVSSTLLWHIYDMVMKYSPEVHEAQKKSMEEKLPARTLAKPAQKKKNKPMSKNEQERNIEHLENLTAQFERQNSGSTEPIRTVEQQDDESSGDDDSDSEEE